MQMYETTPERSYRLNRCIERARELVRANALIIDTETTGLGAWDQAVQVAVTDLSGNVIFNTYLRPSCAMSWGAQKVHGISMRQLQSAPTASDVYPALYRALYSRNVCAYNADFDKRMLEQTARAWKQPSLAASNARFHCVMHLYAEYAGWWSHRHSSYRWHSLEKAAAQCGISMDRAHDALSDCQTTAAILRHIADQELVSY